MSEAIFELKSNAHITSQLSKNVFRLLMFTTEMTTVGRSFSETSRLLLVNDSP